MYESWATCVYWEGHPLNGSDLDEWKCHVAKRHRIKSSRKPKIVFEAPVIDQMPHLTKMQKKLPDIRRKMPGEE